ncbi:MAG: hypothetical protein ABW061_11645 [Polyangiaceae bacterium]
MLEFASAAWSDINALRDSVMARSATSVEEAAQGFAADFRDRFASVVLARVFLVFPFSALPDEERHGVALRLDGDPRLTGKTPVLTLLGTAGRAAAWNDRRRSVGHRAIPLLSSAHVQGIPMLTKLLADLEVNLAGLDDGKPIATRRLLGGRNGAFYVPDAAAALDEEGRKIIPSQDFVSEHRVRTVFGMGGAYADGTLVATVLFTTEVLPKDVVDRFPSVISNFKMATEDLLAQGKVFARALPNAGS